MPNRKSKCAHLAVTLAMLTLSMILIVISALYSSSFLAIIGIAIAFWASILIYISPAKQIPLTLLNATFDASSSNIERIINEFNLTEKGIYLPPKNLQSIETSLIFMPEKAKTTLPSPEETNQKLYPQQKNGVLLNPPGLKLSQLFEQELETSFIKTSISQLQVTLPKILIDNLDLMETAEIRNQGNTIVIEITGSIFNTICHETDNYPKTHAQVGCVLTSALACALAKASGKPIAIQSETQNEQTKTTTIVYRIEEE